MNEWISFSSLSVVSGVNHGGTGRDCPLQSFDWGTAVLTVPPKFKLLRNTAGSCFVRSQKEYITYYNFESAIVKLQFPLCILTSVESRGESDPLTKPLKKLKSVILFLKCIEYIPASCMYDSAPQIHISV